MPRGAGGFFSRFSLVDEEDDFGLGTDLSSAIEIGGGGISTGGGGVDEIGGVGIRTGGGGAGEISPGVRPVSPSKVVEEPPTEEPVLSREDLRDIVSDVRNRTKGTTEVKLSDGTVVKGIPPPEQVVGEARTRDEELPFVTSAAGVQEEVGERARTGWDKVSDFITSPRFRHIMAQTAVAISPESPGIRAAAQLGSQLAMNQAYTEYKTALERGLDADALPSAGILSPELKSRAVKEQTEARRLAVSESYMADLGTQARAAAEGMLTKEERLEEAEKDRALRLELGEMRGYWTGMGQGYALNTKTGEVIKKFNWKTGEQGGVVGNLKSADYKQFIDLTMPKYLGSAEEARYQELVKSKGEETAKQMRDLGAIMGFFRDKETGSLDFAAVTQYLDPQQNAEFAADLYKYTIGEAMGVPRTATYLQQQAAGTVQTKEDGTQWQYDPIKREWIRIR